MNEQFRDSESSLLLKASYLPEPPEQSLNAALDFLFLFFNCPESPVTYVYFVFFLIVPKKTYQVLGFFLL